MTLAPAAAAATPSAAPSAGFAFTFGAVAPGVTGAVTLKVILSLFDPLSRPDGRTRRFILPTPPERLSSEAEFVFAVLLPCLPLLAGRRSRLMIALRSRPLRGYGWPLARLPLERFEPQG